MDEPTLQIYAQGFWHDEAWIVGNRAALTALRDAIGEAIDGHFARVEASASDGEGYEVRVELIDDGSTLWNSLMMPYTDREMGVSTWNGEHPAYVFDDSGVDED